MANAEESLPITEQDNQNTLEIDRVSTLDALRLINHEDQGVAVAVEMVLPEIARVVDETTERVRMGGRIFYIGTGTSGRLGVLDASEIPPTFGVGADLIQGVIAGGYEAVYQATEASEDNAAAGKDDLRRRSVSHADVVIGLAASGRTPYTIGALEYARSLGCFTACITCVPGSAITEVVDEAIVPVVGPEPITGSTRMKSGTAQKLVLNMISTVVMIRLGYVSGNRMSNVKPSNEKLRERTHRILRSETGVSDEAANGLLAAADGDLRVAILMHRSGVSAARARAALEDCGFVIERAAALLEDRKDVV